MAIKTQKTATVKKMCLTLGDVIIEMEIFFYGVFNLEVCWHNISVNCDLPQIRMRENMVVSFMQGRLITSRNIAVDHELQHIYFVLFFLF